MAHDFFPVGLTLCLPRDHNVALSISVSISSLLSLVVCPLFLAVTPMALKSFFSSLHSAPTSLHVNRDSQLKVFFTRSALLLPHQIETHVDGERVRYFQDDDSVGLKEMVRREKMSTPQDQTALYSRMASKVRISSHLIA